MLDIVLLGLQLLAECWTIGDGSTDILYGTKQYVEYSPGDTNLIISVPHDGFIHPHTIPNRTDGCRDMIGGTCEYPLREDCPSKGPKTDEWYCRAVTYSDSNTQDIAREFIREFVTLTGRRPHLVMDNLHRSKMDPNREISRAAQGNLEAEQAYHEYHAYLRLAKTALGGPGLLVDFHGMTHSHEKIELGYLYRKENLNVGDYSQDVSSMEALMTRTGMDPVELISGENSIGSLLEKEGYPSIPSSRQPVPGEDKYYRGGWITQTQGSRDGGQVDAVQIEMPAGIRHSPEEDRKEFTKKLAKVINEFHQRYYVV